MGQRTNRPHIPVGEKPLIAPRSESQPYTPFVKAKSLIQVPHNVGNQFQDASLTHWIVYNGCMMVWAQDGLSWRNCLDAGLANTFIDSFLLRIGRVSVAIHKFTAGIDQQVRDSAGQEPAGKVQLDRDQLCQTRQVLDRKGFLMSISMSSLLR